MTPDERLKRFMAIDKQMSAKLVEDEDKDDKGIIDILNKTVNKIEVDTTSLNKREVTVNGFRDKRGFWHKEHKRTIKDTKKEPVETPETVVKTSKTGTCADDIR